MSKILQGAVLFLLAATVGCGGRGVISNQTIKFDVYNQSNRSAYIAIVAVADESSPYTGSLFARSVRFIGPIPKTPGSIRPVLDPSNYQVLLSLSEAETVQVFHVSGDRLQVFGSTFGTGYNQYTYLNNIVVEADDSINMNYTITPRGTMGMR